MYGCNKALFRTLNAFEEQTGFQLCNGDYVSYKTLRIN